MRLKTRLIDRRDFVRAAGAVFGASLAPGAWARTLAADAVFAAPYRSRDGHYGAAIFSEAGDILHRIMLPERGHDVAFDPVSGRSVIFARQPGTFAIVFDHGGRTEPVPIQSMPGRHFFGHGVFSADGSLLYATENDFDAAFGVVGVYDASGDFTRIGEFPTHGTGPHELLLLPDRRTLAVCNGGIETHPDFGSAKLNLPTMKPSLVFLDRTSGALIEKHELEPALHRLSIRHMDVDAGGTVWFGCQHEGPASERPALVGRARPGKALELVAMRDDVLSGFRNYVGSVAANREAGLIAVSSPQGNALAVIDAATGNVVSATALTEVCGLAPDASGFIATTGTGAVIAAGRTTTTHDTAWDNHVARITG
jgi:hypothetical protein